VNVDPAVQLRLLDLQAADTALAQLAHRRTSLPEIAQIAERNRVAADLGNAVVDAQTAAADVADEQKRLEADVDVVRSRASRDEARLQAGGLPSRELESLQHEIATLARRQGNLEDEVLAAMEQAEEAQAALDDATGRLDGVRAELADLEQRRDAAFAEIDAARAERTPQRAALAAELPAELGAIYEKARSQSGNGAALLRARRCEGCRMELSGSELSALRTAAPDAIVRCENCRTILVRTDESGL
jgi:predicted  nucleic acid-binding Zn-ribbon protein